MSQIAKRYAEDPVFREVADLLYGDGLEISKASPDGADLNAGKKQKRERALQNVAIGTNVVGGVAGPAALYAAVRGRKNGGIPRDLATAATGADRTKGSYGQPNPTKFGRTKVGGKVRGAVKALNAPGSKKAKTAAAVAGGTMVGLQAVNWGGDVLSAKLINDQKKKDQAGIKKNLRLIHKASGGISDIPETASFPSKGQLTRAATVSAARAAGKGAEYVKTNKGKLAKLPDKVKTTRVRKSTEFDVRWEGEISKLNEDKRQVFGWASIVEMNGEKVVDLQGDYIAIDEVEKSAYEYVHKSRKGGDMHLRDGDRPVHASDMIESFVVTPEKKAALGLPNEMPTGWWVGYQVNDPELWAKVKSGERTGFSIHGRGQRNDYVG